MCSTYHSIYRSSTDPIVPNMLAEDIAHMLNIHHVAQVPPACVRSAGAHPGLFRIGVEVEWCNTLQEQKDQHHERVQCQGLYSPPYCAVFQNGKSSRKQCTPLTTEGWRSVHMILSASSYLSRHIIDMAYSSWSICRVLR